jgi:hypothetical protein
MSLPNTFDTLPRRIFLDSCTVQTLGRYGRFIYDGESIETGDRIFSIPNGIENVAALRNICMVACRAQFQWIVSNSSFREAQAKLDPDHLHWFWEIARCAEPYLEASRPKRKSNALGMRVNEPTFGYLGEGDRRLLQDAIQLQCDSFLTVERRLPQSRVHIETQLDIRLLTPISYWQLLRPWAALWC